MKNFDSFVNKKISVNFETNFQTDSATSTIHSESVQYTDFERNFQTDSVIFTDHSKFIQYTDFVSNIQTDLDMFVDYNSVGSNSDYEHDMTKTFSSFQTTVKHQVNIPEQPANNINMSSNKFKDNEDTEMFSNMCIIESL